jgi:opacity protein-like surface antigen
MDVQPLRLRVIRPLPALWIAALLALTCCGTALAAGSASKSHSTIQVKIGGKWNGTYSGAYSGHFTIHWKQTGRALNGTIKLSSPSGKYAIDGSVRGKKLKFGAVTVGAKYKGKLHGTKRMSGTWTSAQGGGSWSAHKVS